MWDNSINTGDAASAASDADACVRGPEAAVEGAEPGSGRGWVENEQQAGPWKQQKKGWHWQRDAGWSWGAAAASEDGGAIHLSSGSSFKIFDGIFYGNKARRAGAIYAGGSSSFKLKNSYKNPSIWYNSTTILYHFAR